MQPDRIQARLLGDYQRLLDDQAIAISERNFAALSLLHEKKSLVLEGLIRAGAGKTSDSQTRAQLRLLGEANERNQELLKKMMSDLQAELAPLNEAVFRLRSIKNVYSSSPEGSSSFFAQV